MIQNCFTYYVLDYIPINNIDQIINTQYKRQFVFNQDTILNFNFAEFEISTQVQKIFYFIYPNHNQSDISEKNAIIIKEMQCFIAFTSLLTRYIKIFGSKSFFIFDNQNSTSDIQFIPELYYHVGLLSLHQGISTQIFNEKNLELYQQISEAKTFIFYLNTQFSLKGEKGQLIYKRSNKNNFTQKNQENINFIILQYQSLLPTKVSLDTNQQLDQIQKNKEFHNFSFFQAFVAQQLVLQQNNEKERIREILQHTEQFYKKIEPPQQYSNILQVPLFLYFVFQDLEDNKQQDYQQLVQLLVDCSYLHKIIHFILAVYINESDILSNNLLLHSSRSGKSTVCKSLYYFYMLLQNTEQVIQYTPFYFLCISHEQLNQPSYSYYTMNNMFNNLFQYQIQLTDANLFTLKEFQNYISNEQKKDENQKVRMTIQVLLKIVDQNLKQFSTLDEYTLRLCNQIATKYIDIKKIQKLQFQIFGKQFQEFESNDTLNYYKFISEIDLDWFNIKNNNTNRTKFNKKIKLQELQNIKPLFLFDEVLQRHKKIFLQQNTVNNILIQILSTIIENEKPDLLIKVNAFTHPHIVKQLKRQDKQKFGQVVKNITVGQMLLLCCPMSYYLRKNYRYDDQKISLTKEFFQKESFNIKEMVSVRNFETVFIRDFQLNFKNFIKNGAIQQNQDYLFFMRKAVEPKISVKQPSDTEQNIQDKIIKNNGQLFSFLAGTDFSIHNMINFGSITKTSQSSRDDFPLVHLTYQGQAQFHPLFLDKMYYIDLQTYLKADSSVRSQINKFDDINALFQFMSMNSQDGKSFTQLLSPILQPQVIIHLKDLQFDNSNVSTMKINSYTIYIRLIYELFNEPLQIFNQGRTICIQTNIKNCQPIQAQDFSQYFYVNSQSLFNIKDNLQVQCDIYEKVQKYLQTSIKEDQITQLVTDLKIHFKNSEIYEFLNILWFINNLVQKDSVICENVNQIIKQIENMTTQRGCFFINSRFQNDEVIINVFEELKLNFGDNIDKCQIQFIHPLINKDYNLDNQDAIHLKEKFFQQQLTFIDNVYKLQSQSVPTLFIMFIDNTKLFQYIQLRNTIGLKNQVRYQTYKQSDFLLKFCNFNSIQSQFSSSLQQRQYFLLEYGPHSYDEILQKSLIVTTKIAVITIQNKSEFWCDEIKQQTEPQSILPQNYNQQNNVQDNVIKSLLEQMNQIVQDQRFEQYKLLFNIIQILNFKIIYMLSKYNYTKLSQITSKFNQQYQILVLNQFNHPVLKFSHQIIDKQSFYQFMKVKNYMLLSLKDNKITFLTIQSTTIILQNWLNEQLDTVDYQVKQYLFLFQFFISIYFDTQQQKVKYPIEQDMQLFFIQYKNISKQLYCLVSLCNQNSDKKLYTQIINKRYDNLDQLIQCDFKFILQLLIAQKYIFINTKQTCDSIIMQLVQLKPTDSMIVDILLDNEKFNLYLKILQWPNQLISHNENYIMVSAYIKKFKDLNLLTLQEAKTDLTKLQFITYPTVENLVSFILGKLKLNIHIIFKDFVSGSNIDLKQNNLDSSSNLNITQFLMFLQNFVIIGQEIDTDNISYKFILASIEPSQTPLETINQWSKVQSATMLEEAQYLKNFNSLILDDSIKQFVNLNLFQENITVNDVIMCILFQAQKTALAAKVDIELFDLVKNEKLQDKLTQLDLYDFHVVQILKFLGTYVILNYKLHDNCIIFHVVPNENVETDSIIHNQPLDTIKTWVDNYSEEKKDSYLQTIKSKLTLEIAQAANLDLFDTNNTLQQLIQRIITSIQILAKQQQEDQLLWMCQGEIHLSLFDLKSQLEIQYKSIQISAEKLTVGYILEFLGNDIVLNYNFDQRKLRLHILQASEETHIIENSLQQIQQWIDNVSFNSNNNSEILYINNFRSSCTELTNEMASDANLKFFNTKSVKDHVIQIFRLMTNQYWPIIVKFHDLITKKNESKEKKVAKKDHKIDFLLNVIGNRVVLASSRDENIITLNIVRISYDETPLQTITNWHSNYTKPHSPEIESYLKLFGNLTEENVKNADQELFAQQNTVFLQIQQAIDSADIKASQYKINKIQLRFVNFQKDQIYHTLDKPTQETVLLQLIIHGLIFLQYEILKSDDSVIIELICLIIK